MNYQTKMLLTYSVFIILLISILGISFYLYSSSVIETNAASTLGMLVEKTTQQLDNLVRPMDFIIMNLVSENEVKSSMSTLSYIDSDNPESSVFISEAMQTMTNVFYKDPVNRNFHRVCIFNKEGYFFPA